MMMAGAVDANEGTEPEGATVNASRHEIASAPMLSRGSRVVASKTVVECPSTDGTLLVDIGAGRRISLDTFGTRVWKALADRPTFASLVMQLRDEDTSSERLAEDVTRLLARWRAGSVISWL